MSAPTRFQPGTLRSAIADRSRTALAQGALQPIATDVHTLVDQGVRFQVRVVSSLARRRRDAAALPPREKQSGNRVNPFLPYEEALFVADVSPTHLCLLNKYSVIDDHVLIVTRAFEPQESPLTLNDSLALWACMAEYDALAFYNSGPAAGASQPHKHLQLMPLPLGDGTALPIDPLLASAPAARAPVHLDALPFTHAFVRLECLRSAAEAAGRALDLYREMLRFTGLVGAGELPALLPPYNLLVTREFMLLIPRSEASFASVPVNALGFAGSFFVADEALYPAIRRVGPLALLQRVGRESGLAGAASLPSN